jgi:uncharacterized UBP type Zn finger protein
MSLLGRGGGTSEGGCEHASLPALSWPRSLSCEECGSTFNLRLCTECGHVGPCESQEGHNNAHRRQSGHPVIRSLPLGRGSFTWCYECGNYL